VDPLQWWQLRTRAGSAEKIPLADLLPLFKMVAWRSQWRGRV
jgi:hypothetical protein